MIKKWKAHGPYEYVKEDSRDVNWLMECAKKSYEKRGKTLNKKVKEIFVGDSSEPYDYITFDDGSRCYADEERYKYLVNYNDKESINW